MRIILFLGTLFFINSAFLIHAQAKECNDVTYLESLVFRTDKTIANTVTSFDGNKFAVTYWDKSVDVFDLRSKKLLFSISAPIIEKPFFSPDSNRIAVYSNYTSIHLYEVNTGLLVRKIKFNNNINKVVFSPDSNKLLTTHPDRKTRITDIRTGKVLSLISQEIAPSFANFSYDSSKIITNDSALSAKIIEVNSGKLISTIENSSYVSSAEFSSDGSKVIASSDKTAKIFDVQTGKELHAITHTNTVILAKFSPDGGKALTATVYTGSTIVTDLKTGKQLFTINGITPVFSQDRKTILTYSDATVFVTDANSGTTISTISNKSSVLSASFSKDNSKVLIFTIGSGVSVYDLKSSKIIATVINNSNFSSEFSPDGKEFITILDYEIIVNLQVGPREFLNDASFDFSRNPYAKDFFINVLLSNPACSSLAPAQPLSNWPIEIGKAWIKLKSFEKGFSTSAFNSTVLEKALEIPDPFFEMAFEYYKAKYQTLSQTQGYDSDPEKSVAFNPNQYQIPKVLASKILYRFVSQKNFNEAQFEAFLWFLQHADVNLDASIFNLIQVNEEDFKREISAILATEAFKYKGSFSLAAIKLGKALLSYKKDEVACTSLDGGASSKNIGFSKTLTAFESYGDLQGADKLFYAKILRRVLEDNKANHLCLSDKNFALRTLKAWRSSSNSQVQYELAQTVFALNSGEAFHLTSFSDFFSVSSSIGYLSSLKPAAFYEQIRVLGNLYRAPWQPYLTLFEDEFLFGLVVHVFGSEEGYFTELQAGNSKTKTKAPQTQPNLKSLLNLCKIYLKNIEKQKNPSLGEFDADFNNGIPLFLNELAQNLDNRSYYPRNFRPTREPKTLREIISLESSEDSAFLLKMIENGCSSFTFEELNHFKLSHSAETTPIQEIQTKPQANTAAPTPPKHAPLRRGKDFDPRGRH